MNQQRGRRLRRLSMRGAVLLAGALAAGALAHTAQASTLAGETLAAATFIPGHVITATCGPNSSDPFTYHVEGEASLPHMGTFTEDGVVVPNQLGQLVSLDATFTITSPQGNVIGEKHFLGLPGGTAFCAGGNTVHIQSESGICYRAEFADGSSETGESSLDMFGSFLPGGEEGFTFVERFRANPAISCGAVVCPPNGDDDNDGLTNNNESRFSTLLGNDDSDFDGIADGNDDANGNGEDDEDEDDEEDDGCPDEDSDDDGEDDEDEDDDEDD